VPKYRAIQSPDRLCFSLREASEMLGVSEWTIGEMARRGEMRSVKIGRRRVIPREALCDYIARKAS